LQQLQSLQADPNLHRQHILQLQDRRRAPWSIFRAPWRHTAPAAAASATTTQHYRGKQVLTASSSEAKSDQIKKPTTPSLPTRAKNDEQTKHPKHLPKSAD
jgi:hypothetical protein